MKKQDITPGRMYRMRYPTGKRSGHLAYWFVVKVTGFGPCGTVTLESTASNIPESCPTRWLHELVAESKKGGAA